MTWPPAHHRAANGPAGHHRRGTRPPSAARNRRRPGGPLGPRFWSIATSRPFGRISFGPPISPTVRRLRNGLHGVRVRRLLPSRPRLAGRHINDYSPVAELPGAKPSGSVQLPQRARLGRNLPSPEPGAPGHARHRGENATARTHPPAARSRRSTSTTSAPTMTTGAAISTEERPSLPAKELGRTVALSPKWSAYRRTPTRGHVTAAPVIIAIGAVTDPADRYPKRRSNRASTAHNDFSRREHALSSKHSGC